MNEPEIHHQEPEPNLTDVIPPLDLASLPRPEAPVATVQSPTQLTEHLTAMGAKVEQDGTIEILAADDPEALLDWAVSNNYILHGSSRLITNDLTPQSANDTAKESGNRTAVYMVDVPAVAMFKALTGGVEGRGTTRHGSDDVTVAADGTRSRPRVYFAAAKPELIAAQGYVYVFDIITADDHTGGEYLSYTPVRPAAVVKILREQFKYPIEQLQP